MRRPQTLLFVCALAGPGLAGIVPDAHSSDPEQPYKTRYRVVNVHRHCADPADPALAAELEVMDRVGIGVVTVLDAGGPDGNLPAWVKLRRKHPDRLVVFTKPSFAGVKEATFFTDLVRDLDRAAAAGAQGVKIWKDLGMYLRDGAGDLLKADDPRLDPFWGRCGELGLPVLIHTADEREYWYPLTPNSFHYGLRAEKDQHYHNPDMPRWEELIRQRAAVLKRHPKTKFIGAHMGSLSFDLNQLADTFDKYPNFHVDCAARLRVLGRLNPPAVRDFFVKYQDRILFGTDDMVLFKGRKPSGSGNISRYPSDDPDWLWIDPADTAAVKRWQDRAAHDYGQYLQYFETDRLDLTDPNRSAGSWLRIPGVKLPPEVLDKLYHRNAEKLIPGLAAKDKKP
ncbi:MAG: Amidohydrolase [Gemmataceae bacterium]|nr:Amidohydrolase [Gemmataceae bacterium]